MMHLQRIGVVGLSMTLLLLPMGIERAAAGGHGGGTGHPAGGAGGWHGGYGGWHGGYGWHGAYPYGYRGCGYWGYPGWYGAGFGLGVGLGYAAWGGYPYGYPYPYPYPYPAPYPVYVNSGAAPPPPPPGAPPNAASNAPPPAGAPQGPVRLTDADVLLNVHVPADAAVWLNGRPTHQIGERREFISSGLLPGRNYDFTVRARWTAAGGTIVDQERRITVQGGERRAVDFLTPQAPQQGPPLEPAPPLPR